MLQLQDKEIGQHIHDLHDVNDGSLNMDFAEDCVCRFIRTFANTEMREEYEDIWNHCGSRCHIDASPGCLPNCRCRN